MPRPHRGSDTRVEDGQTPVLTEGEIRQRVGGAQIARLGTVDPSGQPHLVPISFALVGDVVYSAVDSKPKRTRRLQRLANIERDSRATLLVDYYEQDWTRVWWCMLRGHARVVSEGEEFEQAIAALVGKYAQYDGKPPAGPAVVIEIDRWRGWFST